MGEAAAATEVTGDEKGLISKAEATPADAKEPDGAGGLGEHIAKDATAEAQTAAAAKRERPAYVPEKFWDKDKHEVLTEQVFKSYGELEKNFKHGKHKAPDNGKYDLTVFGEQLKADDPLNKAYVEWATKHGISQAAFDELGKTYVEMISSQMAAETISYENEVKALGANAQAIMTSMVDWARGFVRSGVWSVEDFEEFKVMGGTAAGMRALMKLRESYEGRIPLKETVDAGDLPSRLELEAMIADPLYARQDAAGEAHRAKVTAGYQRLERAGALG